MKNIKLLSILSAVLVLILAVSGLTACTVKNPGTSDPTRIEDDTSLGKEMYDSEVKIFEFIETKLPDASLTYEQDKNNKNIRFFPEGNKLICETKLEVSDAGIELIRKALGNQMREPSETAVIIAEELRDYLDDPTATYVSRVVTSKGTLIFELAVPVEESGK